MLLRSPRQGWRQTILGREEILCTEPKEDCAIERSVPGREGGLEGELCE